MIRESSWRSDPAAALRGLAKGTSPLFRPAAVQVAKGLPFHADLSPDLDPLRHGRRFAPQRVGRILCSRNGKRNRRNRPEVQRDVFTYGAVPARRAHRQPAGFVEKVHGETVQLRLHDIADGVVAPQKPAAAAVEFTDLLVGERVGQAEHRGQVCDGAELFQRGCADTLCRGVRGEEIGEFRFQIGQFSEEEVIVGVGDLRIIQLVVTAVVVEDGCPEGFDPDPRRFMIHRGLPC